MSDARTLLSIQLYFVLLTPFHLNVGQDGQMLCSSMPIYGQGDEPGNEAGYIVGMSTCYPSPGSVMIVDGEIVTLESNYSTTEVHTGAMGLFYILVADKPSKVDAIISAMGGGLTWSNYSWVLILIGIIAALAVVVGYRRSSGEGGYESWAT